MAPTVAVAQHRAGERDAQNRTARRFSVAATDEFDAIYEFVAENYGPQMLALLSRPDIAAVFKKAFREGWIGVQARVQQALMGTESYRTTTDSQRQREYLEQTNPAEARRQVQDLARNVGRVAQRLGVNVGDDILEKIADDALRNGWQSDGARINEALLAHWSVSPETGPGKGTLSLSVAKIRRQFKKYGLPVSEQSLAQWAKEIALGILDPEMIDEMVLEQAKARYPQWADMIDRGMTPDDITSPYREVIAAELEIDPNSIDFADPTYSQVIDGAGKGTAMTMTEAARWARMQPGWAKTDKANRQAADLESTVLRMFGKVA